MNEKEIIARIERLEELAILTHGTLDVVEIKKYLKSFNEDLKLIQKSIEDSSKFRQEQHKKFQEDMATWEQEMVELDRKRMSSRDSKVNPE